MSQVAVVILKAGVYFSENNVLFAIDGLSSASWDESVDRYRILNEIRKNFGSSYILRDSETGEPIQHDMPVNEILDKFSIEDIEIHAESAPVYYEWEKVIFMHKNEYESNFRGMGLTRLKVNQ